MLRRIPGIERIRHRIGKIPFTHRVRPYRQTVGSTATAARAFAIVIAQHTKQRRGLAKRPEKISLRKILFGRSLTIHVLFSHESVTQINVKIRLGGHCAGQRLLIDSGLGVLVEVRVGGDGEPESAAGWARRVKANLRALRMPQP